jgi:hypothetical protein
MALLSSRILALAAVSLLARLERGADTELQAWQSMPLRLRCLVDRGVWLPSERVNDLIQVALRGALAGGSEDEVLEACAALLRQRAQRSTSDDAWTSEAVRAKCQQSNEAVLALLAGTRPCPHPGDDHGQVPNTWQPGPWAIQVDLALFQQGITVRYTDRSMGRETVSRRSSL